MSAVIDRPRRSRVSGAVPLRSLRRPVLGTVTLLVLLSVWQLIGSQALVPFVVPFSDAVRAAWSIVTGPQLTADVLPSAGRALAGFLLGSAVGYVVGTLLGMLPVLEQWTRPTLEFLRSTPVPVLIPVVFAAFGADNTTRIALIALATAWPVLLNAADGTVAVDGRMLDAARVAGLGWFRRVRSVIAPAALPQVFAGLRIALGLALVMMVVSEMVSSDSGLGAFVLRSQRSFAIIDMYAGVLVLATIGGIFSLVFSVVERRVLAWYRGQKGLT